MARSTPNKNRTIWRTKNWNKNVDEKGSRGQNKRPDEPSQRGWRGL